MKSLYQTGFSSTEDSVNHGDMSSDMEAELKNMRELNVQNDKRIKEQMTLIEDLKEELKRKK